MPEYLSPRVYIEEVETGPMPIEGVSTSTTGMVGVTERGPVDIPILVTSAGEYQRWFGQTLNQADFGERCYLPHAVDGFFGNGGKRLYVTRVLPEESFMARAELFAEEPATVVTELLAPSAAGATAVMVRPDPSLGPVAIGDWFRIDDGSASEYRQVNAALAASTTYLPLKLALQFSHSAGVTVQCYAPPFTGGVATTLAGPTAPAVIPAGTTMIVLNGAANAGDLLLINTTTTNEELVYVAASGTNGGTYVVTLQTPLQFDHKNLEPVLVYAGGALLAAPTTSTTVLELAPAGTEIAQLTTNALFATPDVAVFVETGGRSEARRISSLAQVVLATPIGQAYPAGWHYEHVRCTDAAAPTWLTAPVNAGTGTITVTDRTGFNIGDTIRIGNATDPTVELMVIRDLPGRLSTTPDPGRIVLAATLQNPHGGALPPSRQIVARQTVTPFAGDSGTVAIAVPSGATSLILSQGTSAAATGAIDALGVELPDGEYLFNPISSVTALIPQTLTLSPGLSSPHNAGVIVVRRHPLIDVEALDAGAWGNRLRVAAAPEGTPRVRSRLQATGGIIDPTHIRLDSPTGVEPGTILSLADAQGNPTGDPPFKVVSIDRQNNYLITLAAALPPAAAPGANVVSLEFRIDVYLLRQPDPAIPSRNVQTLDSESFRNLSLDPRNSRYIHQVIGTTFTVSPAFLDDDGRPLRKIDNRSEGDSSYIRVRDLAQDEAEPQRTTDLQRIRLGPEFLIDILPDGRERAGRLPLVGGDDQVPAIDDNTYIGVTYDEPRLRTGLQSLTNINEISLIAAPGVVSATVQGALITQCEQMLYRFSVLDAIAPPDDTLVDVQNQRQQFDSKYAALYHPWLVIPDPYPANPAAPADFAIPPAGHVLGVYARIDDERGVHKAPANEVVRGITGLARTLNEEQHDILNPYPVNINVIRDFRPINRAIRIYGARCITSDSDWKYVNVRRLVIFIEASLYQGLQWVVFEPNADPLWARVRRSITNFLMLVWRNGALEGTKPEEAFFVKCDRTTMTQTDIDEGRLICLVGIAPVKPAEFVIVRIGLWTAQADGQ